VIPNLYKGVPRPPQLSESGSTRQSIEITQEDGMGGFCICEVVATALLAFNDRDVAIRPLVQE